MSEDMPLYNKIYLKFLCKDFFGFQILREKAGPLSCGHINNNVVTPEVQLNFLTAINVFFHIGVQHYLFIKKSRPKTLKKCYIVITCIVKYQ